MSGSSAEIPAPLSPPCIVTSGQFLYLPPLPSHSLSSVLSPASASHYLFNAFLPHHWSFSVPVSPIRSLSMATNLQASLSFAHCVHSSLKCPSFSMTHAPSPLLPSFPPLFFASYSGVVAFGSPTVAISLSLSLPSVSPYETHSFSSASQSLSLSVSNSPLCLSFPALGACVHHFTLSAKCSCVLALDNFYSALDPHPLVVYRSLRPSARPAPSVVYFKPPAHYGYPAALHSLSLGHSLTRNTYSLPFLSLSSFLSSLLYPPYMDCGTTSVTQRFPLAILPCPLPSGCAPALCLSFSSTLKAMRLFYSSRSPCLTHSPALLKYSSQFSIPSLSHCSLPSKLLTLSPCPSSAPTSYL